MYYKFMLITQKNNIPNNQYFDFIKQCADGGITSLQLREKHLSYQQLLTLGGSLIKILEPYKIPLVINDFPLLAQELNTPYIHIGQKDESISTIASNSPDMKIGLSIENEKQLLHANTIDKITYITASAVFSSTNKNNLLKIWGLTGLLELSRLSKHPITAIGGITLENTDSILEHGAKGIAVIGAVHNSSTPYQTCKKFRTILDNYLS